MDQNTINPFFCCAGILLLQRGDKGTAKVHLQKAVRLMQQSPQAPAHAELVGKLQQLAIA